LIKSIDPIAVEAYQNCSNTAFKSIYRSPVVLDVELAGFKIISTLLDHYVEAVLNPDKAYSKKLLFSIPEQYDTQSADTYSNVMAVLDYISGMTDIYALDLYRKITGINIPGV
jgi:dGTPase